MSATCPNGHVSVAEDYCDTCGAPIAAPPEAAGSSSGPTPTGAAAPGGPAATVAPGESPEVPETSAASATSQAPEAPETAEAAEGHACPNCGTENIEGALFCEACGYDFTTGAMPRTVTPGTPLGAAPAAATGAASAAAGATTEGAAAFEWVAEVWVDPDWYRTQEAEDPCPSPGLPTIVPLRQRSVLLGRVSTSRNTHPEIELSSDPGVSRRHAQLTTDGTRWFVEDLGSSNGTFVGPASGPLPEQAIPVGPRTELGDDDRLYVGAWTRVVVRRATPEEVETFA
jgi:ribosomal protein L37AE/L43A